MTGLGITYYKCTVCAVLTSGSPQLGVCLRCWICLHCILGNPLPPMPGVSLRLILVLKVLCPPQPAHPVWRTSCHGPLHFLLCQKVCPHSLNCAQVQRSVLGCLELFCVTLRSRVQVCLVSCFFQCPKNKFSLLGLIGFILSNTVKRYFIHKQTRLGFKLAFNSSQTLYYHQNKHINVTQIPLKL